MSYPGYPPYQQAPNMMPGNLYPQQQPYPGTGAPCPYPQQSYPPNSAMSYPPSALSYPPSQVPYPNQSPYPSNPSPYPSNDSPYPSPYPSNPSPYPSNPSPYPPNDSPYPPNPTAYPPNPYPPNASPYPPVSSPYPPTDLGSAYNPQGGQYPPSSNPYPSAYPPPSSGQHGGNSAPYPNVSSRTVSYSTSAPTQAQTKRTPTVVPANPFNPDDDSQALRKAMKGFGTDEKAIIDVLCNRTNAQRQQIALQFKTNFGKDLVKDLKGEISGKFEDLVVALMTPIAEFYAKELSHAMAGIGTNEDTLIEVLCTMSNAEIHAIRTVYRQIYGSNLENAIKGDTGGTFKRLMVSLCNASRDESYQVDQAAAMKDAQQLLQAGELRMGTDESTFNMILCRRSYPQLKVIFDEYQRITGHDIENAIKNEFSGEIQDGLLAIIRSVRNLPAFFAKQLYQSMEGAGTKDRKLIRIISTRCELDLGDIKREFQAKYGKSLAEFISGDCSGDYKKCLLALVK